MAQPNSIDEIIGLYKRDVDVTLLDTCLRRTVEERLAALELFSASLDELRDAVREDEPKEPVIHLSGLIRAFGEAGVDFILVGGVAAAAHGSARVTQDVDLVYRRGEDNLRRIVAALAGKRPYLRGAPPGLPFQFDVPTLAAGLNFTLTTDLGAIDLLGEIAGGGRYEDLVGHCISAHVFGVGCRVLDLETLIATKRAAGRPKDFEALAELEILKQRR